MMLRKKIKTASTPKKGLKKKTPAKKSTTGKRKKASEKSAPASPPSKRKVVARKKTIAKKPSGKKPTIKKPASHGKITGKRRKETPGKKGGAPPKLASEKKEKMARRENPPESVPLKLLKRSKKNTPAVFKLPSKKLTPIVFSLDEVREVIRSRTADREEIEKGEKGNNRGRTKKKAPLKPPPGGKPMGGELPVAYRRFGAAKLTDILGFNPKTEKEKSRENELKNVPKKFLKYYRKLTDLRDRVKSGLDLHTKSTLKRSLKEDSGDLSSYSQHMADLGTDNFDRDFALSLLSNEQEALFEIEEAIQRILRGNYGICEITGNPIKRERLEAVPFTRYSREGQEKHESLTRKKLNRKGIFVGSAIGAPTPFGEEESEN